VITQLAAEGQPVVLGLETLFAREEFETMIDFLVLHKDYEAHRYKYWRTPVLIEQGIEASGRKFEYLTRQLGQLLGNELYQAYLGGRSANERCARCSSAI
jgi:hypothetical protein